MSYTQKGTISSISEISEVGTGKKLTFRIKTDDQYNPLWEFEMYKSGEYVEHLDNFIKFNKVGTEVEVEFNIKTFNWKPEADNKIFTSLSAWKVNKVGEAQESVPANQEDSSDQLPF